MLVPQSEKQMDKDRLMQIGDRVQIIGKHPWTGTEGTLGVYGSYGLSILKLKGWLVKLDNGQNCYAKPINLQKIRGD